MSEIKQKELSDSIVDFVIANASKKTYAILYAPNKCYLGIVDARGTVIVKDHAELFNLEKVFEARVFNEKAELRWLRGFGEATISDGDFETDPDFVAKLEQRYLLWGQRLRSSKSSEWVEFGSARIGSYHVPLISDDGSAFARIGSVEYLMLENDSGNVFVADERLVFCEQYATN